MTRVLKRTRVQITRPETSFQISDPPLGPKISVPKAYPRASHLFGRGLHQKHKDDGRSLLLMKIYKHVDQLNKVSPHCRLGKCGINKRASNVSTCHKYKYVYQPRLFNPIYVLNAVKVAPHSVAAVPKMSLYYTYVNDMQD